ncbi:ATP-binding protein [Anaeromyxobacter sp. Red801]|uniref:ATP-binding protein n=1 Tax=Anaeromyxobacter sp. Red801 TaxID=3411632 RepID=UPI003BA331A2
MRRPDLSIGTWVSLGFAIAGALLAGLVALAVTLQGRIAASADAQLEVIGPRAVAAASLESAVLHVSLTARAYALTPEPARMDALQAALRRLEGAAARFAAVPKQGEGAALADRILAAVPPFEKAAVALGTVVATGGDEAAIRAREATLPPMREELLELLRGFGAIQQRHDAGASHTILAYQRDTVRTLVLAFVAVALLLAAIAWVVVTEVRRPAKRLVDAARRLAAGDYSAATDLEAPTPDTGPRSELAELARAFATMAAELRDREERVAAQNEELQAQNEELQAKEEELYGQNEELQAQQEELQAQNEELQAQGEALRASDARLTQLVEALSQADRRKNEFLAVLSHELRNPLAPVLNALTVLDRGDPAGEQGRNARQVIARQVAHLARLVDDLLDVARITQGKIQLRRTHLELGTAVRQAAEDLGPLLEARGLRLALEVPERELWVHADAARIAQVVGNLVQNAAKFTDGGGTVTVAVDATPEGRARVRVRDDGIGMPPEVLQRLFQPFVQAEGTLARTRGGLGLGLALVKGLVELHGGTVDAASAGAGRGATFTLELPLDGVPVRVTEAATPRPAAPRRVLVVEDNRDSAETLRDLLELAGHHADIALDARQALERCRTARPDAIVCDLGLPDMDGYELARTLRADPELASVLLVALSGYALPDDLARSAQAGFDAHLAKPARFEAIEALLAGVRRQRG